MNAHVVDPDDLMTVDDVLSAWPGKFTANELRTGIARGQIGHVRKGRQKLLTRGLIRQYLSSHLVTPPPQGTPPCQDEDASPPCSNSGDSGSTRKPDATPSIGTGMTETLKESAVEALAQRILKRPSIGSPNSSSVAQLTNRKPQRVSR